MEHKHACLAFEIDTRVATGGACRHALPVHRRVCAHTRYHAHIRVGASDGPAPILVLRIHVGPMREQRRRHVRVPFLSGDMERRQPAADRAHAHTASASPSAQPCKWERACVRVCVRVCVLGLHACMHVGMNVCIHAFMDVSMH
jgi:hypothetical protein